VLNLDLELHACDCHVFIQVALCVILSVEPGPGATCVSPLYFFVILFKYLSPTNIIFADFGGPHYVYVYMVENMMYID
jgi:hypothetical protein